MPFFPDRLLPNGDGVGSTADNQWARFLKADARVLLAHAEKLTFEQRNGTGDIESKTGRFAIEP